MNTRPYEQISDQELAQLHVKFIVPLAVSQMLSGQEPLDDVAEYAIHDIIGGLQPDTALLCVALCAQHLAAHLPDLPIARALRIEADMIIDDYGPIWLANEAGTGPRDHGAITALLCHIPEDFESLGDLLDATLGELGEAQALAAILCDILGQQARAHRELAESELEAAGLAAVTRAAGSAADNVIPFPQRR